MGNAPTADAAPTANAARVPSAARVPTGAIAARSVPDAASVPIAVRAPSDPTAASIASRGPNARDPTSLPHPSCPQRPKPKRLRPGKAHRGAVLDALPEEQRPIAELALLGLAAVRQRLRDDNQKLLAEGKAPMPEASVLKMAEELLPRLRVAEWLDRAEAARDQIEHLDLRDLRSVVASSDDPMVARDETTRQLAGELKAALATKQEQELQLWFGDIDAALRVGRVIRALRLSSQPPKAGVPFPTELAQRLTEGANTSLTPADGAERWCAVLEAAAFSPIRTHVAPSGPPATVADELRTTVTRLAPALPQVAAMFGIEPAANASMPKPLRPTSRPKPTKPPRKPDAPAAIRRARRSPAQPTKTPAAPDDAAHRRHPPPTPSSPPSAPDAEHGDQASRRRPDASRPSHPNPPPRLRHRPPRPTRKTVTKASRPDAAPDEPAAAEPHPNPNRLCHRLPRPTRNTSTQATTRTPAAAEPTRPRHAFVTILRARREDRDQSERDHGDSVEADPAVGDIPPV